jgi:conserved oligomeric Golgi complex subunit 6
LSISLTWPKYQNLLQDTGLRDAVKTCETKQPSVRPFQSHVRTLTVPQEPLSRIQSTEPAALSQALRTFATWLSYLEAVHSTRLAQLSLPELHARVHRAALRRLANAYAALCFAVRSPENKYEAAATLLGSERPFGSMAALWQIFGMEPEEGSA